MTVRGAAGPSPRAPYGGSRAASQTLPEWLGRRAYLTPEAVALIFGDERWSFRELDHAVDHTAARLWQEGIQPGDHVALLGQNSVEYILALGALMRLGAVAVPLNTRLSPEEIAWQINDSDAAALVVDDEHLALAGKALESSTSGAGPIAPKVPLIPLEAVASPRPPGEAAPSYPRRSRIELDSLHGIIYTSGTTGRPKGAMLTYGNHWWNAIGSGLNLGGHRDDVWLAAVPLFHVSGLSIVMRSLIHGFAVLLHQRFDPALANRAIDQQGVTLASVVSVMLSRMLQERGGRKYPPHLRAVLVGGGPVPEALLRRALDLGMPVLQTYGMTETASQAATLPPHDALRKLGSAGKPLFPVELKVDAPPGEVGEILVRGPGVSPGYYRRPEESKASRREEWFRTGDLGWLDAEGYLYVVDRRSDLIISGGENVYPAEVERVLESHPAVLEAGVAGKADEQWGQVPIAFVVPKSSPSHELAAELIAYCRSKMARYKAPVEVHFVPALPRNAAGKLARHRLRELLTGDDGRA